MKTYHLSIITPNGQVFDGEIESLVAPGDAGSFGILARHRAMVSSLKKGVLKLVQNAQAKFFNLGPGVLEVDGENHVVILTDEAVENNFTK